MDNLTLSQMELYGCITEKLLLITYWEYDFSEIELLELQRWLQAYNEISKCPLTLYFPTNYGARAGVGLVVPIPEIPPDEVRHMLLWGNQGNPLQNILMASLNGYSFIIEGVPKQVPKVVGSFVQNSLVFSGDTGLHFAKYTWDLYSPLISWVKKRIECKSTKQFEIRFCFFDTPSWDVIFYMIYTLQVWHNLTGFPVNIFWQTTENRNMMYGYQVWEQCATWIRGWGSVLTISLEEYKIG